MGKKPKAPPLDLSAVENNAASEAFVKPDSASTNEASAIREGNYEAADAEDSYGLRKSLKDEIKAHAKCIFRTAYALFLVIVAFLCVMTCCYIYHLSWQPEKMASVLGTVATHGLAVAVGLLWNAVYAKRK